MMKLGKIYRTMMAAITLVVLNASASYAEYADGTEMAEGITEFFGAFGKAILYGVFAAGILLFGSGLWNLASPNPRSSKTVAVGSIIVGAIMCAATAMINITSGTMTGGEAAGLGELNVN